MFSHSSLYLVGKWLLKSDQLIVQNILPVKEIIKVSPKIYTQKIIDRAIIYRGGVTGVGYRPTLATEYIYDRELTLHKTISMVKGCNTNNLIPQKASTQGLEQWYTQVIHRSDTNHDSRLLT